MWSIIIRDIIKPIPLILKNSDTIDYAVKKFFSYGLNEAPVVKSRKVVGIVNSKKLLEYVYNKEDLFASIEEVMDSNICMIEDEMSFDELESKYEYNI